MGPDPHTRTHQPGGRRNNHTLSGAPRRGGRGEGEGGPALTKQRQGRFTAAGRAPGGESGPDQTGQKAGTDMQAEGSWADQNGAGRCRGGERQSTDDRRWGDSPVQQGADQKTRKQPTRPGPGNGSPNIQEGKDDA